MFLTLKHTLNEGSEIDLKIVLHTAYPYSMIIQSYWWIIQCNEFTTTQAEAGVLGCERDFTL